MRRSTFHGVCATLIVASLLPPTTSLQEDDPHARAPQAVELNVLEDTWLRAPDAAWFERQAELEPGRFTFDAALHGQGGWVDATNVYQLRYDEAEGTYAYWQFVSAKRLTAGRRDYVQFCASCHGFDGAGYGRSGQHLRPSPRSFKQSNFKFTKVVTDLPTDAALLRLIRRGLDGTPMYPWALSDEQLLDIIQYIKSLSEPETGWRDVYATIGDVVPADPDPWEGRDAEARARGEEMYHGLANCYSCHPAYVSESRLREIRGEPEGTRYRDNLSYPELKESNYEVRGKAVAIMPPDFTWHRVRSGTTKLDLFETIASGIKGTAMPQWKGSIPDSDIWALSYYVRGLINDYHGQTKKRAEFMNGLRGN
jgi:mono/diheme cytochrome c family protein